VPAFPAQGATGWRDLLLAWLVSRVFNADGSPNLAAWGSGTPSGFTFYRGDGVWATPIASETLASREKWGTD
jgi:hypothetical protein